MKFLLLIIFLICAAVRAEDVQEEEANTDALKTSTPKKMQGSFTAYGAFNNLSKKKPEGFERKPYGGVFGVIKFKSEESFKKNDFGFTGQLELNSEDISNPIQIKEAGLIIEGEKNGPRIFGFQRPVTSKMKVNSTTFSGANEGLSGRWQNFIYYPVSGGSAGNITSPFLTKPYLALESGIFSPTVLSYQDSMEGKSNFLQPSAGWGESAVGLSYITPRFSGVRVGISYFPDNKAQLLSNRRQEGINGVIEPQKVSPDSSIENKGKYLRDIFSLSTNYYSEFRGMEVLLSAGYETANISERPSKNIDKNPDRKNLVAYSIGANISYMGVTIGGSFIDMRKSLQVKDEPILLARSYDIGIGYSIDKYNISVSHFTSKYMGNGFSSLAFSFETKLTKNLINYLQIARYRFNIGGVQVNDGNIVMIGIHYKV